MTLQYPPKKKCVQPPYCKKFSKDFRKRKIAKKVERIFEKYDKNEDDKLQQEEMFAYFRQEDSYSTEAFELLFDEIDVDNNGEISKEELYDYFIKQEADCDEEEDCISKSSKFEEPEMGHEEDSRPA